jgi:phosphatidylserine/phosphatidylglycerophosphate/cardiolipin synthase-like enzyme
VAEDRPPQEPNEVYDTDLALIFYDDPVTGRYQRRFDAIFADPRNLSVRQNLQYFATLYRRMEADRKPLDTWLARSEFRDPEERQRFTDFYRRFYAYLDHERIEIAANLKRLAVVASADRAPSPHAKAAAP